MKRLLAHEPCPKPTLQPHTALEGFKPVKSTTDVSQVDWLFLDRVHGFGR